MKCIKTILRYSHSTNNNKYKNYLQYSQFVDSNTYQNYYKLDITQSRCRQGWNETHQK